MKKTALTLTSILFILLLASCSSTKKTTVQPKTEVINIKATNLPEQIAYIQGAKGNSYEIKKIQDGHFADTLKLPAGYYTIQIGQEYSTIYLKPGMKLEVSLDGNQFDETIHYKGKGAEINNFLAQEMLLQEKFQEKYSPKKLVSFNEKDFLKLEDSVYNSQLKRLKAAGIEDPDFIELQTKKYLIEKNTQASMYPMYKSYFMHKPFKVSKDYPKPLEGLDINDKKLMHVPGYLDLVESSLSMEADPEIIKKDYALALLKAAEKKLASNPDLKEAIMVKLAKSGMGRTKYLKEYYEVFNRNVQDPQMKESADKMYQNLLKLQAGNPSPDFKAFDVNGKEYHLSDFKGKNIYIDLWATWCAPCRAEIPFLEKLKKDYEGKNIEFVSIDVYDNKDKWEKMVKSGKITGVQLRIPDDKDKFLQIYNVRGIPRFIFIDKDGNIIDNNVSRPSNPATRKLIDKYVTE